jgi:hypothetical protein
VGIAGVRGWAGGAGGWVGEGSARRQQSHIPGASCRAPLSAEVTARESAVCTSCAACGYAACGYIACWCTAAVL